MVVWISRLFNFSLISKVNGGFRVYIKHGENNKKNQSFVINLADFFLAYEKLKKNLIEDLNPKVLK